MDKEDLQKMWNALHTIHEENACLSMALKDLVASACYMRQQGETEAAGKALETALDAIGITEPLKRRLLDGLDKGYESQIVSMSHAHDELKALFR